MPGNLLEKKVVSVRSGGVYGGVCGCGFWVCVCVCWVCACGCVFQVCGCGCVFQVCVRGYVAVGFGSVCVCVCVSGVCVWGCACVSACALFPGTLPCWERAEARRVQKTTDCTMGCEAVSFPHEPDADFNQFNQWAMFAGHKNSPEVASQRL